MNWVADATAGTKIRADRHDSEDDNFASGLSNTLCKDGQSSPTADIGFNGKKITNLADPVNDQDAVTKKYMLGGAATQGLWTKLGFASADMSLLGRAAGSPAGTLQRIAYNDKADGTGNDVFVVNDDGTVSARAADGTYKKFQPATAETRNRIVNGAMQISQENGNTAGTGAWHVADQWYQTYAGTVLPTAQRVQVTTPNGSINRARFTITTADATLTTNDIYLIVQKLEGIRTVDFRWGTASARQVVLRFGFKAPAGTYSIALIGGQSYVANFTITAGQANTDTEQIFVIPGSTTGTWPVDTSNGVTFNVTIAAGPTYVGVAGWQAGGFYATASNSNGMATAGNVFELFDVGLHLDPNATGVAPPWQMPDEAAELAACQRYYHRTALSVQGAVSQTIVSIQLRTAMRVTPAVATGTGGGTSNCTEIGTTMYDNVSGYWQVNITAVNGYMLNLVKAFSARM